MKRIGFCGIILIRLVLALCEKGYLPFKEWRIPLLYFTLPMKEQQRPVWKSPLDFFAITRHIIRAKIAEPMYFFQHSKSDKLNVCTKVVFPSVICRKPHNLTLGLVIFLVPLIFKTKCIVQA